ncbi:hypothetical protein Nepgr_014804 [Nepenthes gracilis]|uniref:Uncharacterized protein n=1 Tax=Nepenthes gracilis TaxID=150966 RepID=A0AAD3SK63_NEPGR|nr:hypothetical protein Nepgr_014804 [Nepenthes gracilis]
MQTAQEVNMKNQGNRHQLPSKTKTGLRTIPASFFEASIIIDLILSSDHSDFFRVVDLLEPKPQPTKTTTTSSSSANSKME